MNIAVAPKKPERVAVGLISGTSVDGVDAALVKVRGSSSATQIAFLDFLTHPYPVGLPEVIIENSQPGHGSVDRICSLNAVLGEVFAEAVLLLLKRAGASPAEVDFIGSHGQTVHHLPIESEVFGFRCRSTLQLGEPCVIAKRTGILTVADFRPSDMALGGEGAPLVPYFDFIMFRSEQQTRALVNIGGIANITLLPKAGDASAVLALDTGPGNMVIDKVMQRLFGLPYDAGGKVAAQGKASEKLLTELLQHPYFGKRPPKSTGREEFGADFAEGLIERAEGLGLTPEATVATAAELTVRSLFQSYDRDLRPVARASEFIVSGGGVHNQYLMRRLAEISGMPVNKIDKYGVPSDAKEAICFAVLANETLHGVPSSLPSATGAARSAVLGKICLP